MKRKVITLFAALLLLCQSNWRFRLFADSSHLREAKKV